MKGKVIDAVLFDFGGVLAEEGFRNGLVALAQEQGLDTEVMLKEGTMAVYDSGFVLGRGTANDFWTLLRKRTGLVGDNNELSERILSGFVLRPWMIELVTQLRNQGYITGILSDQTYWLDTLNEREHFVDAFDRVYNSYYLGKGKQDPSLFNDVAVDLGMSPSKILFVDDDAGNVTRACDAGMQAIQFVDRRGFISELKQITGHYV